MVAPYSATTGRPSAGFATVIHEGAKHLGLKDLELASKPPRKHPIRRQVYRNGERPTLQPRTKLWHIHSGSKVQTNAVSIDKYVNGSKKRFRVGLICPYCGFEPNDNLRRMHQEVLERILAKQQAKNVRKRSK